MRRVAITAALVLLAPASAFAQKGDDDEEEVDSGEEEETIVVDDDASPAKKPAKKEKEEEAPEGEFKKQDLRGHAVDDSTAAKNVFEKDRFFVDKVDSKKTLDETLIQGSLASSSFLYTERGGSLGTGLGDAGSEFSRLFTELRLQTDFRHIAGSRWDARIDTRARFVNSPGSLAASVQQPTRIQSGFNGTNEYEVREAWIVRSGERSDIFLGRQFINDLGGLKIDGLRVDYAKSERLTFITFGGLYPLRGSRSISTDYDTLKANDGTDAGKFVGAGGFGAAYRTQNLHGAFGGVALVPLSSESPRVYGTSNGYWRNGSNLDFYHFAIIDAVGSAAPALTNLSAGLNFKPGQRLRMTASFNRVDTETLNVQANMFLQPGEVNPGLGGNKLQNEAFLTRLSTNSLRGGISAGLGSLQRFEISTAATYRLRPEVTLTAPDNVTNVTLRSAQGVDVFFALIDRRSIADLRLGIDASRSFAVGNVAFQRSEVLAGRVFASREFKGGRGEWELEVGYASTRDVAGGTGCGLMTVDQCFGTSEGKILSAGGNLYYRIGTNWFILGNLFLNQQTVTRMAGADPAITGISGFARIALRF